MAELCRFLLAVTTKPVLSVELKSAEAVIWESVPGIVVTATGQQPSLGST
jgi:hypothetical protein